MFPASKLHWLLEHFSNHKQICLGTIDSWLIHCFTNGKMHVCDASNAARTQLFDIKEQNWSSELCDIFEISRCALPNVLDSAAFFGTTLNVPGVPDGTPICAAIGDSHAALFGHGAFELGDGKVTFGTGSSIMTTLPDFIAPQEGITTTIAWRLNGKPTYAFEGNILVCASSLPWMAEILGLPDVAALIDLAASIDSEEECPGFIPAFVGLGAPYWHTQARALFSQITFNTSRAQMARAVTNSLALQVHDVFMAMQKQTNIKLGKIYVDGGPSKNNFLMQSVANFLVHPVIQREIAEISAMGAAYLAGLSLGMWQNIQEINKIAAGGRVISPQNINIKASLSVWKDALARSMLAADELNQL